MAYCYNCGNSLETGDRFCGSCGATQDSAQAYAKSVAEGYRYGYVFTNVRELGRKLNVGKDKIMSLLTMFINEKTKYGTSYRLVDVSDYEPMLDENRCKGKSISLSSGDSWEKYQRVLIDRYVYDSRTNDQIAYLFIVGGDDIIPMPVIPHFDKGFSDKTIDSDLPYSYLYGSETLPRIEDRTIFTLSSHLLTGRLPLAVDASLDDLSSYLDRSLRVSRDGFEFGDAYGQSDPSWKRVSACVTERLYSNNLMTRYNVDSESTDFLHKSLVLSPVVDSEILDNFFPTNASLYYFNMHGSDAPQMAGFTGNSLPDENDNCYSTIGITPEQWTRTESPNIVVTEACYGARFIGKTCCYSMLLSAMRTNTVVYVGSSRVSLGTPDRAGQNQTPSYADVIARVFIEAFLWGGYDAGVAMHLARMTVASDSRITPLECLTVTEFNLFGDPTVTSRGAAVQKSKSEKSARQLISEPLVSDASNVRFKVKVSEGKQDAKSSILGIARRAVDNNVDFINRTIGEHLYEHFKIKPRRLEKVMEIKYDDSIIYNWYKYSMGDTQEVWVEVGADSRITKVITTK